MSGLADIQACVDNPTLGDCVMAVAGVTPWGKLKLVAKIDKGIDAIKGGRAGTAQRTFPWRLVVGTALAALVTAAGVTAWFTWF